MLIWWTSEADCHAITGRATTPHAGRKWPKYLITEYTSRLGRNGRGRLWVDKQFGEVAVDPWPDTNLARRLGDAHAGIVIRDVDLTVVERLPGIVTDFNLNPVGSDVVSGDAEAPHHRVALASRNGRQ